MSFESCWAVALFSKVKNGSRSPERVPCAVSPNTGPGAGRSTAHHPDPRVLNKPALHCMHHGFKPVVRAEFLVDAVKVIS